MRDFSFAGPRDSGFASADADYNFVDQFCSSVRKRDAVSGVSGICQFPLLQLLQKPFGIVDLIGSDKQIDDFADRFCLGARAKTERDLFWIDQFGQGNSHEEMLDSVPVIRLIE